MRKVELNPEFFAGLEVARTMALQNIYHSKTSVLGLEKVLYDQLPQHPVPEGWFFRLLIGLAALMRGFGALLAMITGSILFVYPFEPLMRWIPMPRRLGENLLQGIPFLIMSLLISWVLVRYVHK